MVAAPPPTLPEPPTIGEVWRAIQLPIPVVGANPVSRGVKPFSTYDEWYVNMRWLENGRPVTHLTYSATGTGSQAPGFFPDADFEAELLPFRRSLPGNGSR